MYIQVTKYTLYADGMEQGLYTQSTIYNWQVRRGSEKPGLADLSVDGRGMGHVHTGYIAG